LRYPGGLHVQFEAGQVDECWTDRPAAAGATRPTVDPLLAAAMKPGMSPAEVAEHLGPPAFGYTNKGGRVVLRYTRRGVEVSYRDGRLAYWPPTDSGSPADRPPPESVR